MLIFSLDKTIKALVFFFLMDQQIDLCIINRENLISFFNGQKDQWKKDDEGKKMFIQVKISTKIKKKTVYD